MFLTFALSACSLLVSTSDLTGGDGDGGSADAPGSLGATSETDGDVTLGDAASYVPAPEGAADASSPPSSDAASGAPTPADSGARSADAATDSSVVDAGQLDTGTVSHPDGGCSQDLSNIGAGDFGITFTFRSAQSGLVALVDQRAECSPSTFWDVRLSNGQILVETDDGTNYVQLTSSGPDLDDGASHTIIVARASETLTIVVDGADEGSTGSSSSFGALAPLALGPDSSEGHGGTVALTGTIGNVCVGSP